MSQIEAAQYIVDEFVRDGRKVVSVEESAPLEALISLDSGKPIRVTGLFAQRILREPNDD